MKIGILADIHEALVHLEQALREFQLRRVDIVVSLGDAFDSYGPGGRSAEVATLLQGAGAVGVWGNHDIGLSYDVPDDVRRAALPETLTYLATYQPQLVLEDCRFSHVEPWLDATKAEDLWYFDEAPNNIEQAARSFNTVPELRLFIGHFHRWLAVTPDGVLPWNGSAPLVLSPDTRSFVIVAPVLNGWCAIYDTETSTLTPIRC